MAPADRHPRQRTGSRQTNERPDGCTWTPPEDCSNEKRHSKQPKEPGNDPDEACSDRMFARLTRRGTGCAFQRQIEQQAG